MDFDDDVLAYEYDEQLDEWTDELDNDELGAEEGFLRALLYEPLT